MCLCFSIHWGHRPPKKRSLLISNSGNLKVQLKILAQKLYWLERIFLLSDLMIIQLSVRTVFTATTEALLPAHAVLPAYVYKKTKIISILLIFWRLRSSKNSCYTEKIRAKQADKDRHVVRCSIVLIYRHLKYTSLDIIKELKVLQASRLENFWWNIYLGV